MALKIKWSLKGNRYTVRGRNSLKIALSPSEKGSTLYGKNLLPLGANYFPYRIDPFSEGT